MRYLIESALCLAAFYGLYHFILRRETFFQWNRAYLLLAPLLAMLLPALNIVIQQPESVAVEQSNIPAETLPLTLEHMAENPLTQAWQRQWQMPVETGWSLSLWDVVLSIYALVALFLLSALAWRFARLFSLIKKCRKQRSGDVVIATGEALPLASFFSYVFWNEEAQASDHQRFILEHEIAHARQWHSLDVLFMELMLIIQWFNPLMYAYRKSLSAVHEYIADDYVVRRTQQRQAYATLLVQQAGARAQHGQLYNTFHSLIKQRLLMLIKRPSHPLRRAKYALALPVAALLMLLFSFRMAERLPVAKPFMQAIEKADHFVKTLDGITIVATAPRPPEKTPYIFYWGSVEFKIDYLPNTDEYFGTGVASYEQLSNAVQRQPRLWNGKGLTNQVSFKIDNQHFVSNLADASVYEKYKAAALILLQKTNFEGHLIVQDLELPNGKKATLDLILTRLNTAKKDDPTHYFTWDKILNSKFQEREFVTRETFFNMFNHRPEPFLNGQKEAFDLACSVTLLGEDTAMEVALKADQNWADRVTDLKQFSQNMSEFSAYFDDVNAITPTGSVHLGAAVIHIVPDHDPRLLLTTYDRKNYNFEWGLNETLFGRYAIAVTDKNGKTKYADNAYTSKKSNYITRTPDYFKELFGWEANLSKGTQLLNGLTFRVRFEGLEAIYQQGVGLPKTFIEDARARCKAGTVLVIDQIKAEGADLSNVTIHWVADNLVHEATPLDYNAFHWGKFSTIFPKKTKKDTISYATYSESDLRTMLNCQPNFRFKDMTVNTFRFHIDNGKIKTYYTEKGWANSALKKQFMENIRYGQKLVLSDFEVNQKPVGHTIVINPFADPQKNEPNRDPQDQEHPLYRQLAESMRVLPNPVTDVLRLEFEMPQAAKVHIHVIAIQGQRTIQEFDYQAIEGPNIVTLNAGLLTANGSYVIYVDTPFGRPTAVFEKL